MNVMKRRLELLQMEGNGFNMKEIVEHLSSKYECSPRLIYYDFKNRVKWQPPIVDGGDVMQKILNRYEHVYREAAFHRLKASHDNVRLGALRLMLDATDRINEVLVVSELVSDVERIKKKIGVQQW